MAAAQDKRRAPFLGLRSRNSSGLWKLLAVVAFIVVDILLIALALNANQADPSASARPVPSFASGPSAPSPSPSSTPAVSAGPRLLTPVSADVAWRASEGGCPAPSAVVERSVDRGATWQAVSPAGDAHRVLGLEASSGDEMSLVAAAGADCAARYFASFTAGQFFEEYPSLLGTAVYRDPADQSLVHTDHGDVTAACPVLQVAERGGATGVLCVDTVGEQPPGGEWDQIQIPGALSVAATGAGYVVAVSGVEGCEGIAIEGLTVPLAESARTPLSCVADSAPSAVTLAAAETDLWLWSGDTVRVSPDGGLTWP